VHTRVIDRTFNVAAGLAARINAKLNVGFALHYVLRLYETSEDALSLSGSPAEPAVGAYHATASFETGNLVGLLGAKYRYHEEWVFGASLGLPGIPVHSAGNVRVQDVITDPRAPEGERSVVIISNTTDVNSRTFVPLLARLGIAWIKPHRWTLSGQLTGHLGTKYDRFSVATSIAQRLRVQDHIERGAVLDANLGGEYLVNADYSLAAGLFSSRSGAPELRVESDGTLARGSSRQPRVSVYGGTFTLGLIGPHAISRLGMSIAYGSGDDAVPNDPTGILDPQGFKPAQVNQLFLYIFLASTFRY
jgi:hypothetical protein